MILSLQSAPGKPKKPIRLRPDPREGLCIQYKLRTAGKKLINVSERIGLHSSGVYHVVSGRRHSARIEAEIARILGKADWNEVVLEARSEVQKKPVEQILREREEALRIRGETQKANLDAGIARRREELVVIDQRRGA